MSTSTENKKKQPKIPPALYVTISICFYFIYQSYSRLSIRDFFSGFFFLIVAIVLLVASFSVFKQHKDQLK